MTLSILSECANDVHSSQHPGHIYLRSWCYLHVLLFLADMALPRLRLAYINSIILIYPDFLQRGTWL